MWGWSVRKFDFSTLFQMFARLKLILYVILFVIRLELLYIYKNDLEYFQEQSGIIVHLTIVQETALLQLVY